LKAALEAASIVQSHTSFQANFVEPLGRASPRPYWHSAGRCPVDGGPGGKGSSGPGEGGAPQVRGRRGSGRFAARFISATRVASRACWRSCARPSTVANCPVCCGRSRADVLAEAATSRTQAKPRQNRAVALDQRSGSMPVARRLLHLAVVLIAHAGRESSQSAKGIHAFLFRFPQSLGLVAPGPASIVIAPTEKDESKPSPARWWDTRWPDRSAPYGPPRVGRTGPEARWKTRCPSTSGSLLQVELPPRPPALAAPKLRLGTWRGLRRVAATT